MSAGVCCDVAAVHWGAWRTSSVLV